MYYAITSTATGPTDAEINGLRVITGLHGPGTSSPHNFSIVSCNPNVVSNTADFHRVSCSVCKGEKPSPELHTFNHGYVSVSSTTHVSNCACGVGRGLAHVFVNNVCKDCGYRR